MDIKEFCNRVFEEYQRYQYMNTGREFEVASIAVAHDTEHTLMHAARGSALVDLVHEEGEGFFASICGLKVRACTGVPKGKFLLMVARP